MYTFHGGRKGTEEKHVGHTTDILSLAISSDGKYLVRLAEPINAHRGQKQPDNFDEILKVKAKLGKYLKEKC